MKYYYDIINNSVFSIDNFEYTLRENQDYEITEEEFNNYLDKLSNFYDVVVEIVDGKVTFIPEEYPGLPQEAEILCQPGSFRIEGKYEWRMLI